MNRTLALLTALLGVDRSASFTRTLRIMAKSRRQGRAVMAALPCHSSLTQLFPPVNSVPSAEIKFPISYTWIEVYNWPVWERQFAYGPCIHHCSCPYGHCAEVLTEAARFLPELRTEQSGLPVAPLPRPWRFPPTYPLGVPR